jgi:hypothetical protein
VDVLALLSDTDDTQCSLPAAECYDSLSALLARLLFLTSSGSLLVGSPTRRLAFVPSATQRETSVS